MGFPVVWLRVEGLETGARDEGEVVGNRERGAVAGSSVAAVLEAAVCEVLVTGDV